MSTYNMCRLANKKNATPITENYISLIIVMSICTR